MIISLIVSSLACVSAASSSFRKTNTYNAIAGYVPGSDVVPHSQVDLDMQAMITDTSAAEWSLAYSHYHAGGNSVKSSGAIRTIRGFSTAFSKMDNEPLFKIYKSYWGIGDYADNFVIQALNNTGFPRNCRGAPPPVQPQ